MAYTQAMREALALARQAAEAGDVPVGAVVLDAAGRIIGRGCNTREAHGDPLAHAEILAMREATQTLAKAGSDTRDAAEAADMDDSDMDFRGVGAAKPYATHRQSDCMACRTVSDDEIAADGAAAERPCRKAQCPHSEAHCARVRARSHFWNLADCTLVVTLEPCPMCAGACVQTHIGSIVFGAWDAKLGACGSVWDIPRDPHVGHAPEVYGGILEADCQAVLTDFFTARR
ncbi:hypothetical protein BW07_10015 [Bifidobacterium sp. UTCIF-36]|nr:hypothetical protein BW07_10015 [Bifidobacterium sp. UTCIF-36]